MQKLTMFRTVLVAAAGLTTTFAVPARAQTVTASLSTVTAAPGETAIVTLAIFPDLEGLNVRSIQVRMPLSPAYVSNAVWQSFGPVTTWGPPFTNTTATFTAIAAFGPTPVTSTSTSLARVELTVAPGAPLDTDLPLTLDVFLLNGGTPATVVVNGLLRVRTGTVGVGDATAAGLALAPPAPSPVTSRTRLAFTLPGGGGSARLAIYAVDGRRVRVLAEGITAPGRHERTWDATDESGARAPAGIYFLRLEWNGHSRVQRVAIAR